MSLNTRWFGLRALAVAAMLTMQPAAAQPEAPAHVRKYVADARVAGQGRLTWLGFHVYDAALYAPAGFTAAGSAASPFVLELTYARKLSGKSIAERSRDEIERLGYGTPEQRARWFAQMAALFPDVEKGKRLAGVNVPGGGARFYLDGRFLGTIDAPAFAQAFFAIWFDERTAAPQLRASLLGPAAGRSGA
ncbi:MAG: chalcone isomerase family protein [Betaproteobacteria bacterium]